MKYLYKTYLMLHNWRSDTRFSFKKISTLFTCFYFLCLLNVKAQPDIEWERTFGGSDLEYLWSIQNTSDGGYILGGYSYSNISGDKTTYNMGFTDIWIVKLSNTGDLEWEKTYGGTGIDDLRSIEQTSDGGYIIGAFSNSNTSDTKSEDSKGERDYWVIKINSTGVIEWDKTIGGSNHDFLLSAHQTEDDGYILGGHTYSGASGDKSEDSRGMTDFWVVKLDEQGSIEWEKTIGGLYTDELFDLKITADKGYILGGHSSSDVSGEKSENRQGGTDFWAVKLNANGEIEWDRTFGGLQAEKLNSLAQTIDGGYILGGTSNSDASGDKSEDLRGQEDYWIVRLDELGNKLWDKTYGGISNDELWYVDQVVGQGYILGGFSQSPVGGEKTEDNIGYDIWLVMVNENGAKVWDKTIGGSNTDYLYTMHKTPDGGYILGSFSYSNAGGIKSEDSNGSSDYWVIKLAGDLGCSPPQPSFNASTSCVGNATTFTDVSTDIEVGASYEWDINDDGIIDYITSGDISHTYEVAGNYTAKLTVTQGECTDSYTSQVVVHELPTAVLSGGGNICIGGSANLDIALTGVAPWVIGISDGATESSISVQDNDLTDGVYYLPVSPSNDVTYTLTSVSDANCTGIQVEGEAIVSLNAPPLITNLTGIPSEPTLVNSDVTAAALITDNNIVSATWDWGDNSQTQVLPISPSTSLPSGTITSTHNYTAAGVYVVSLTIENACGISNTAQFDYLVIYDPNGGYVAGSGLIHSPLGAFTADPSLEGDAKFGFQSKYQKGASVPSGRTSFEFKTADMHFKSTSYEWLILAGSSAKYKGVGTINGTGNYGFMLSALDGDLQGDDEDKFRIKIWDKDNNDNIVYDNQVHDPDDAPASTTLKRGAIRVRKPNNTSKSNNALAIELNEDQLSSAFYCYPSIFSDETTIAFILEQDEEYQLEIFSANGALVKKIASGKAKANQLYEIKLRGDKMVKGLYLVRLSTASQVRIIKAVLQR